MTAGGTEDRADETDAGGETDDEGGMREKQAGLGNEWMLVLAARCAEVPGATDALARAVVAEGGWVLRQGSLRDRCVEVEFEFPRRRAVAMYGSLLAAGLELSREAHAQLAGLCHCTGHVGAAEREEAARVFLSVYEREGSEAFLGDVFAGLAEAA